MFIGSFLGTLILFGALYLGWTSNKRSKELAERLSRAEDKVDSLARDVRDALSRRAPPASSPAATPSAAPPPAPLAEASEPLQPAEPAALPSPTSVPAIAPPARGANASTIEPPQTPQSGSLEERLGTRWAVWAGGLALALGGLFLVRYSIEAGLIGPGVRVTLGALLAASLIAAGEYLRRSELQIPIEALPQAHIPSILTAAGTIIAFGTIYAAHALYGFLGPAAAFALLGATGIATMLASALHGPALAGLGLAGAFVTPLLVTSETPSYWPLTLYFAAVAAAAYMLARMRQWLWLAMTAVAGAAVWGLMMVVSVPPSALFETAHLSMSDATMAHVLVQLALGCGFLAYEPHLSTRDENAAPDRIALTGLLILTLPILVFAAGVPFAYWGWQVTALAAVAILTATGWLTAPAASAIVLSGVVALVALAAWPGLDTPPDRTLLAPYASQLLRLPENVSAYLTATALWTLAPAAAATYRIWRGPLLPVSTSALYAAGATLPPLLALVLAYLRVTQFDTSISFAAAGIALAAFFAIIADRFQKADNAYSVPAYEMAAGAFAAAAIAALAFALTVSLSRGLLTVALALTALGTAYVSSLRGLPLLRHVVSALGVIVLARLAWDPRIMGDALGTTPIFNWLLIGYGVPALAFWQAARLLERVHDDVSVRISDSLSLIFIALLGFFQIRHFVNSGDIFRPGSDHVEAGLMTLFALLMSYALAKITGQKRNPVFDAASLIAGVAAIAFAAFGLTIGANPYVTGDAVEGRTFVSSLLVAYLLPGLAALYVARHARSLRPQWYTRAAGILAVALIFLFVTLETRHAFKGPLIGFWNGASEPESWALSVAWLMLGIVFLAYGLLRSSLEARIASAALVILAALKVTLYDLAGIGGLWRALSFLCLGAVLIGIGLVYQKFVFARTPGGNEATDG